MPGFQTDAISAIKELRKRSTDERFHEAVVTFDEMYLSKKMELHRKTQHILGPYNKVMVCMMRGLTSKQKQPIHYSFQTNMTKKLINKIILRMEQEGFTIRGVICDMGNPTFIKQFNMKKDT